MESTKLNNELPKADDFFMLCLDARDLKRVKKHKEVEAELEEFYATGNFKQETLEEKCSRLNRLVNTAIEKIKKQYLELDSKDIQINDLKDQLSRTYIEEEVSELVEMLQKCKEYFLLKTDLKSEERADAIGQVLEQFKKK